LSRVPRILPLVGVAIGGVLAVNAIANAPRLISATRAFAESAAAPAKTPPPIPGLNPAASAVAPVKPPAPACAPTAAELAKEAGLSPAELQVLQSLGNRRGELDQRASDLDVQVNLIAAAQNKLDSRIQQMNALKADIQALLGQADQQQQAETESLVRVYEAMKPKDAAARMTLLDDSVRLPMAAKMNERKLSAILSFMAPEDAKALTEKLARRVQGAAAIMGAQAALNPQAAAATPPAPARMADGAVPTDTAAAKPPSAALAKAHKRLAKAKPKSKAVRTARATPPASAPAPSDPAAAAKGA
jgi:flagellar motility protein MotE (MotC chaperone)